MLAGMINDICGNDLFDSLLDTLSVNLLAGGPYAGALTIVNAIYRAVMPAGVMLMFVYFLIGLVDKLTSENFNLDQLWRQLALLFAAKYLMEHSMEILRLLSGIGQALTGIVGATGNPAAGVDAFDPEALLETFRESLGLEGFMKIFQDFFLLLYLLIPWVASWIMRICIKIICYSRVVEVYLLACFAPIPLSDFFQNGFQGAGWKYLKGFLARALQGALILAIGVIFTVLFRNMVPESGLELIPYLAIVLTFDAAAVMLMFRSLSLAKEIVGVA